MRFRWVQSRGCGARSAPRGIHRGEGRPDGRHGRRGRASQAPRVYFRARRGTENAPDARGDASRAPQRGDDDAVTSDAAHLHDRKVHDGLHALHSAHGNVGHRLSFRAKTTRSPKSDATPANEPKRAGRVRASARETRVCRDESRGGATDDGRSSVEVASLRERAFGVAYHRGCLPALAGANVPNLASLPQTSQTGLPYGSCATTSRSRCQLCIAMTDATEWLRCAARRAILSAPHDRSHRVTMCVSQPARSLANLARVASRLRPRAGVDASSSVPPALILGQSVSGFRRRDLDPLDRRRGRDAADYAALRGSPARAPRLRAPRIPTRRRPRASRGVPRARNISPPPEPRSPTPPRPLPSSRSPSPLPSSRRSDDEDPVDHRPDLEEACKPKCAKFIAAYDACVARVEKDTTGEAHCTGQYFDMWGCVDKCVAPNLFKNTK